MQNPETQDQDLTVRKSWPQTEVLQIAVDCVQQADLLTFLLQRAQLTEPLHVVTINAEMAYAASLDPELKQILDQADLVIPDGIGVVWALKHQGVRVARLPGVELVEQLLKHSAESELKLAILGSSPETLEALQAVLQARFGKVKLVFCQHGYYQPAAEPEILERLRASGAQVLFVALGVPRQEQWIAAHKQQLGIPVLMGVGGSFDVISGRLERAPLWMRRAHLEWLYRLLQQPSRWRRMLALPKFVLKVLRT